MTEKAHARLSPSGAHGWMRCPGWESDPGGSKYADEGTAAHTLAAWCLTERKPAVAYLGRVIPVNGHEFTVDEDMASHVQIYVDRVLSYAGSVLPSGEIRLVHTLLVEQAVPIDHVTGEEGAEGTSDAIILLADESEVQAHDLKFGQGERVDAEENPQLMLYGLGVLRVVEELLGAKPQRVRCVIHQPRLNHLSEWECTVEQLQAFAVHASNAATVYGEGERQPGQKQCRWCARKASCPALAAFVQDETGADFEVLDPPTLPTPPEDCHQLARHMAAVDLIEDWCRAVRAEVEKRLFAGEEIAGYKLVEGKRGARQWSDETAAEDVLKSMRLKHDEMYSYKLISPTQAEKLLKDSPKRWERLGGFITQSQGKPSVAPITDKRPALVVGKSEDDFEALT